MKRALLISGLYPFVLIVSCVLLERLSVALTPQKRPQGLVYVQSIDPVEKREADFISLYEQQDAMLKKLFSVEQAWWFVVIIIFFIGFMASLTPCMYPMIALTIGSMQLVETRSVLRNVLLSIVFLCGVVVSYASLGVLVAHTNMLFGQWIAAPLFIGLVIIFTSYIAASLFGIVRFYAPSKLFARGSFLDSFVLGSLSGIVTSARVAPAFVTIVSYMKELNEPILAFVILLSFSCGMTAFLFFVGLSSSLLYKLPRSHSWLPIIKIYCGFLVLATSVSLLRSRIPGMAISGLYLLIAAAVLIYTVIKIYARLLRK